MAESHRVVKPQHMEPVSPQNWMTGFFQGEQPRWQPGKGFLPRLLACAQTQRAHVLLVEQLLTQQETLELSPAVVRELATRQRQEFALEMLRREEVSRMVAALGEAGLPFLLFKGTPLAYTLYPDACLRDRSDTDLLFESRAAAEEAWQVLQDLGYERMNTPGGELVSYQFPCILRGGQVAEMLDVHWATSNAAELRPLSFRELWDQSIAVPSLGAAARSPCHEHALVLACLHRLAHVKDGEENRLIWLYDIHLLLQSLDEAQWQRFLACARDKGVAGACCDGVEHAADRFGISDRGALRREELRQLAALPGQHVVVHATMLERDIAQLRAAQGLRRVQLLGEYLFPPADYMQARYQPRWRWLLPWYYARRIAQGTGRRLRSHRDGSR
ncbi:MAG: nucleotidyltransferase family protein [Halioglobus sp.]|nr:nucleotidyltransferase family protein [Halioglobus sp.]